MLFDVKKRKWTKNGVGISLGTGHLFFWSQRIQLTWDEEIWKEIQIIYVQEETGTQSVHLSSEMSIENSP